MAVSPSAYKPSRASQGRVSPRAQREWQGHGDECPPGQYADGGLRGRSMTRRRPRRSGPTACRARGAILEMRERLDECRPG